MSQEKLEAFHRLVEAEQYRDARGILETETDIPPEVAEKWLAWLEELQREERLQQKVVSDPKKETEPARFHQDLAQMVGGTAAIVISSIGLWLLVVSIMTYRSTDWQMDILFMLIGLPAGFLGWQYAARLISPSFSLWLGTGIQFVLYFYLISAGLPLFNFYDPPLRYLIAGFALYAPAVFYLSYRVGAGFMKRLTTVFLRN